MSTPVRVTHAVYGRTGSLLPFKLARHFTSLWCTLHFRYIVQSILHRGMVMKESIPGTFYHDNETNIGYHIGVTEDGMVSLTEVRGTKKPTQIQFGKSVWEQMRNPEKPAHINDADHEFTWHHGDDAVLVCSEPKNSKEYRIRLSVPLDVWNKMINEREGHYGIIYL